MASPYEYALGKAIRAGQERGEIRKPGDNTRDDLVLDKEEVPTSPKEFIREGNQTMTEIYGLVDGVTGPEFEAALSVAKAEGNVSRANVVRKVRGVKSEGLTPVEKLVKIRALGR